MDSTIVYNDEQLNCISQLKTFIKNNIPNSKLLINGSAGTGKTTIIIYTIFQILSQYITNDLETILNEFKNKKND